MRRLVFAVVALAAFVFLAAPAAAQGTGGFQFGLSGGVSTPTGDTSDVFDTGYHGGIVLNYELPALPLGLRLDGDYRKFDTKSSIGSGSAEIFDGNANLVLGLRIVFLKVYALAGAGFYSVKFSGAVGGISASGSQTDFGWNGGVGAAFVVGSVSIFLEGRYHEVTLANSAGKFKFIPVSAGVLF